MKFGIFDHVDRSATSLGQQYEDRLRLIEAYDRGGFHAYHLAEHHATPLGMAPSPAVFLAAVAQRSRRLRFGPLVYTLSLHHPLRVVEEICMLDQMSGGRLELGVGRGISPHEVRYYGVDPAKAQAMYVEALAIIRRGLSAKTLSYDGEFYHFHDVPIEMEPVQRPHPPLWYGMARPDGVPWATANNVNIVCSGPAPLVREITDRYRREWAAAGHRPEQMPFMGLTRSVVVADTDREAVDIARRAYRCWYRSFILLWEKHGSRPINAFYPTTSTTCSAGDSVSPARRRPCATRSWLRPARRETTISSAASPSATFRCRKPRARSTSSVDWSCPPSKRTRTPRMAGGGCPSGG
jgi:alkanesulfonate monooxygenase SsuD/methylene tetrahydromethanopterin reductase-like flavin-dependent oxidoreductase (luciferase family)